MREQEKIKHQGIFYGRLVMLFRARRKAQGKWKLRASHSPMTANFDAPPRRAGTRVLISKAGIRSAVMLGLGFIKHGSAQIKTKCVNLRIPEG